MSIHARLGYGDVPSAVDVLDLHWVSAHRGDHHDFLQRHRRQARRVARLGRSALERVAPSLLHRVSDERTLRAAWDHLQEHGGQAPGPDGHRYDDFTTWEKWRFCRGIRDEIRAGEYAPDAEEVRWVAKGPGRGRRPLVLQSIFDRVVQRAAVEVLQPLLDPRFDPRSFGFRPRRSALQALALAERLSLDQRRRVWVTADARDAFTRVPLPRLLGVVGKYLPADDLVEFLGQVLGGARTPGLRQGGPLSPLLLNLYLHHHLDRKWRRRHADVPLLRYADDILLLCRSRREAGRAYDGLSALLRPAGMLLKEGRAEAVRTLTPDRPAEWMGFRIKEGPARLCFGLAEGAWACLAENLALAQEEPNSPVRAFFSICGWVGQKGPCYAHVNHDGAYDRIAALARAQAFDEIPGRSDVKRLWQRAHARWGKARVRAAAAPAGA